MGKEQGNSKYIGKSIRELIRMQNTMRDTLNFDKAEEVVVFMEENCEIKKIKDLEEETKKV